jgi:hypothetical protein
MKNFICLIDNIKFIFLIGFLLLSSGSSIAGVYAKPGTEPDGFRGVKCGTEINKLKDMQYVGVDQDYQSNEVLIYYRKGDILKINGATLSTIKYRFWRGLFFNVEIITKGYNNFMYLLRDIQKTFGKGLQPNKHVDEYHWYGNRASIVLKYDTKSHNSFMYIQSGDCSLINEEYELSERQQSKLQGANK